MMIESVVGAAKLVATINTHNKSRIFVSVYNMLVEGGKDSKMHLCGASIALFVLIFASLPHDCKVDKRTYHKWKVLGTSALGSLFL